MLYEATETRAGVQTPNHGQHGKDWTVGLDVVGQLGRMGEGGVGGSERGRRGRRLERQLH